MSRLTADRRSRDDQYRLNQEEVRSRKEVSKKQIELRHDVFDHSESFIVFSESRGIN